MKKIKLNNSEIEYINALAPYDHGVWSGNLSDGNYVEVGKNALFKERSYWLLDNIINLLLKEFTYEDLKNMTILEVGSYDGWILTNLCERIQFKEAIGVEPREKNIKKGQLGRKLSGIKPKCKFIKGSVSDIEKKFKGKKFNIVMCLGMIHHVNSTYETILKLGNMAYDICILDTMIIPELKNDIKLIEPFVNTKDIVYQNEKQDWSIAAFKYESPYGDGSTNNLGIVNLPTQTLVNMSLKLSGFDDLKIIGTEKDFYKSSKQNLRGVKEILLYSKRLVDGNQGHKNWQEKVEVVENIFCKSVLPEDFILSISKHKIFSHIDLVDDLSKIFPLNKNYKKNNAVLNYIIKNFPIASNVRSHFKDITDEHLVIINVFFRCPFEKILLEISKFLIEKNHVDLAIKYLKLITKKPGCDWWSFYRSCYLLKKCFNLKQDTTNRNKYNKLLFLSNEYFPFKD